MGGDIPQAATILVTNDDGFDPKKAHAIALGRALAHAGHDVTVVAPFENKSACGQSITLDRKLSLRRHKDLEDDRLHVFSLEGTPADCTAAAIEPEVGILARMQRYARLCVSGVNVGSNLGTDVIYSGTVAGARQAALYGIPSIATSITAPAHRALASDVTTLGIHATTRIVRAAMAALPPGKPCGRFGGERAPVKDPREAFIRGDIILNVNIPEDWSSTFSTVSLDSVLYTGGFCLDKLPHGDSPVQLRTVSGGMKIAGTSGSDTTAVKFGLASISPLQTFPWSHPLYVPEQIMNVASIAGEQGMPAWLSEVEYTHCV